MTKGACGLRSERTSYRPFGEQEEVLSGTSPNETRGFIGERQDTDAGLQFLNARYYDPKLGLFLQPDWWEVTKAGVGTNRYAYAGNDPVNARDPGGNAVPVVAGTVVRGIQVAIGVAISYFTAKDIAKDLNGSILSTPPDDFDIGQESLKPDELAQPISTGTSLLNGFEDYIEGMSIERGMQGRILADPALDGNQFGSIVIRERSGPKTDPNAPHNRKIRELGEQIVSNGGRIIAGGGINKEAVVDTPGGYKNKRRPDIVYEDQNGRVRAVNVGRTNAKGEPVRREREALRDLNEKGSLDTSFERYD